MATMRTTDTLDPPPSPIPTATGSRSAANQIFTEYLEHSLRPPNLALPATTRHPIPSDVDLRSLASRGRDSVDRLLQSARQYGVFRISGHGISSEELGYLVEEAEPVFRNPEALNLVKRNGNREEIVWARSRNERLESAPKFIGSETERYRNFRQIMEKVAGKLDAVAKESIEIFMENAGKKHCDGIQEKETVLALHRYDHNTLLMEKNSVLSNEKNEYGDALTLHLPSQHSQFHVQSKRGPLSFELGPDTIVVTVGKQLEEWSLGEFKSVSGEMIIAPDIQGIPAPYCVELKYSSSSTYHSFDKNCKTISIADQILFALIIILLYKVFVYALS
ncbi:gibberellin 2-beta-dioxygenase 8 [Corylus avellana]|uniref:gibberellin 2-beta-dioxygenase 8 n=1 Tax=Corylus avellana TaxID=13451 RepID=UPI00286ADBC8|nr:gibberellin 2-beta-dioxygenase 8 [Corylus avellana]